MFSSRMYKFTVKNTSKIVLNYLMKIVNAETGVLHEEPYTISPKKGSIAPGCDENFVVMFSPTEIEQDFSRLICCKIGNLNPTMKPLIIELDGVGERPVCHFELPPSHYKERREKEMNPIDSKYNIIEFESIGTKIKNTKRFMVTNPTGQGYEFEWEQLSEETKDGKLRSKPMFNCVTPKGIILSGKKFEMIFEYTPEGVGEHESYWNFKVLSEKISQPFLIVGRVIEPLLMFEHGKIDFGPLLLGGKNKETINITN